LKIYHLATLVLQNTVRQKYYARTWWVDRWQAVPTSLQPEPACTHLGCSSLKTFSATRHLQQNKSLVPLLLLCPRFQIFLFHVHLLAKRRPVWKTFIPAANSERGTDSLREAQTLKVGQAT
jgi:hypothetical protein